MKVSGEGPYVLIAEYGLAASAQRFMAESLARTKAKNLWVNWILYHERRGGLDELAVGGVGFSHESIRKQAAAQFGAGSLGAYPALAAQGAVHGDGGHDGGFESCGRGGYRDCTSG